eukprot:2790433-Pyramimonas_sp.AAC.1
MDREALLKEKFAIHKVLRLPPGTFRKADVFSFAGHGLVAPQSALILGAASMWRCSTLAITDWAAELDRWRETAALTCSVVDWIKGEWSAPCWIRKQGIAQRYADLVNRPPRRGIQIVQWRASHAAGRMETRAAQAVGKKPKLQRAVSSFLRLNLYPNKFEVTISKRLSAWGLAGNIVGGVAE